MIDLNEFGIHEGISEVILTTISPDGVPNAAPIGLHLKDGRLFARIYSSRTLENIMSRPVAAANIVDDPMLFVRSSLSDVEPEKFEYIKDFPVIKNSAGWILFECKIKKGNNISVVELKYINGKINQKNIRPVNRGFNAVIEAAILATRYVIFHETENLDRIRYHNSIVTKCGGMREKEAMRLLYELAGLD